MVACQHTLQRPVVSEVLKQYSDFLGCIRVCEGSPTHCSQLTGAFAACDVLAGAGDNYQVIDLFLGGACVEDGSWTS